MTASVTPRESTARVSTDTPERYAKQLASHLGRKVPVEQVDDGHLVHLAGGTCLMTPQTGTLVLAAQAPDDESLTRLEDVVGGHLARFGARNALVVEWSTGRRHVAPDEDGD